MFTYIVPSKNDIFANLIKKIIAQNRRQSFIGNGLVKWFKTMYNAEIKWDETGYQEMTIYFPDEETRVRFILERL